MHEFAWSLPPTKWSWENENEPLGNIRHYNYAKKSNLNQGLLEDQPGEIMALLGLFGANGLV